MTKAIFKSAKCVYNTFVGSSVKTVTDKGVITIETTPSGAISSVTPGLQIPSRREIIVPALFDMHKEFNLKPTYQGQKELNNADIILEETKENITLSNASTSAEDIDSQETWVPYLLTEEQKREKLEIIKANADDDSDIDDYLDKLDA